MAESFGIDPQRYDRARPRYPSELIARIVAGSPGPDVLDVGCGTGIAARQFQGAGCMVLGVDPDARMADYARQRGLTVEVATFETWQPAGRTFDAVIAAQSWHWVDPRGGAEKAARVLRPHGRLALFGHVFEPPPVIARPSAEAYRRAVPDSPFNAQGRSPLELYQAGYLAFAEAIAASGHFDQPEQWRYDWEQVYSRERWLDLLPTTGGMTRLSPDQTADILSAVGHAIDALGGELTVHFTTLATSAIRAGGS